MDSPKALLARLDALVPALQRRAPALDEAAAFPSEDLAELRAAGLLSAAAPQALGGAGLGTEPWAASAAFEMFRMLGRGNLALGRLIEAHVNTLRLVMRYGDPALQRQAAEDAAAGHLMALWVTDPAQGGLTVAGGLLVGAKQFCSAAGHATRAVVTAADSTGDTRLVYADVTSGCRVSPLPGGLAGMRAAATGQVRLEGARGTAFGAAGDYLREPDLSCGAWRTSAVTLGGIEALTEQIGGQLAARGRQDDPHQQARMGRALIATETARLWLASAASRAEATDAGMDAVAYVGLARLAVEQAAFEVIEVAQRSLGVAAVMRGNPAERIARDLAAYLRQPAADSVLTEAAAWSMRSGAMQQ